MQKEFFCIIKKAIGLPMAFFDWFIVVVFPKDEPEQKSFFNGGWHRTQSCASKFLRQSKKIQKIQ